MVFQTVFHHISWYVIAISCFFLTFLIHLSPWDGARQVEMGLRARQLLEDALEAAFFAIRRRNPAPVGRWFIQFIPL